MSPSQNSICKIQQQHIWEEDEVEYYQDHYCEFESLLQARDISDVLDELRNELGGGHGGGQGQAAGKD